MNQITPTGFDNTYILFIPQCPDCPNLKHSYALYIYKHPFTLET